MAKKVENKEEKSLEQFDWDSENTFFGVEVEEEESVVDEVKVEEDEEELEKAGKTKPAAKEGEEEEEEDDSKKKKPEEKVTFFEDEEGEGGNSSTTDDGEEGEAETVEFTALVKDGLLPYVEIAEDEEITAERVKELIEENTEKGFEELMAGIKDDAGEDGAAFIKFLADGGNRKEFFKIYREEADAPDPDLETEEGQDEVIKFYAEYYTKIDKKDINDQLEWLNESGKKKAYAEKYLEEIKEDFKERKQELAKNQENKAKQLELNRKKTATTITDKLQETEKIGNYAITKADKKKLGNDITKATEKIGNNKFITPLQKRIGEIFKNQDPTELILLAKVVMSEFDTSDVETKAATKTAKNVKRKVVSGGKRPASSPNQKSRRLSDFFTEEK